MKRAFIFTVSFLLIFALYIGFVSFYAESVRQQSDQALLSDASWREARALAMLSSSLQSFLGVRDLLAVSKGGSDASGNATTNITLGTLLPTSLGNPSLELSQLNQTYNTSYAQNSSEVAGYLTFDATSLVRPVLRFDFMSRTDALTATFADINRSSLLLGNASGVLSLNLSGTFNVSCQAPNSVCNASVLSGTWTNANPCPAGTLRVYLGGLTDASSQSVTVAGAGTSSPCASLTSASGSSLRIQFPSNSTFTLNVSQDAFGNPFANASVNASLSLTLNWTTSLNGTRGVSATLPVSATVNNRTVTSLPVLTA